MNSSKVFAPLSSIIVALHVNTRSVRNSVCNDKCKKFTRVLLFGRSHVRAEANRLSRFEQLPADNGARTTNAQGVMSKRTNFFPKRGKNRSQGFPGVFE